MRTLFVIDSVKQGIGVLLLTIFLLAIVVLFLYLINRICPKMLFKNDEIPIDKVKMILDPKIQAINSTCCGDL